MHRIVLFLFLVSTLSCAGVQKRPCQEPDWYELGRRDGAVGKALNYDKKLNKCKSADKTLNTERYHAGRYAGLVQYCSVENAKDVGRAGEEYHFVCPSQLESEFLIAFRKGQRIYKLESQNLDIDERIKILISQLEEKKISPVKESQIDLLQKELLQTQLKNKLLIDQLIQ